VNRLGEVFADPQVRHRGMAAGDGARVFPGPPIKLSETPASIRTEPAGFGEHTDAVLAGLGMTATDVGRLRAAGVV
jgi:crotonobetainyl-CoA:carnitine CoA-transferase CaiB-like acyl-CoA transferase